MKYSEKKCWKSIRTQSGPPAAPQRKHLLFTGEGNFFQLWPKTCAEGTTKRCKTRKGTQ